MRAHRLTPLLATAIMLAGCGTWFGDTDDPPLPGDRISVMLHERSVSPDPGTEGTEILLPAPSVNQSWPQSGGYANHAMHHILVADDLKRAWGADIGSSSDANNRYVATPIVAEGKVFSIDSSARVSAFDANSGKSLWRTDASRDSKGRDHINGGLAYESGRVFVAVGVGDLVALDAGDGKEVWRKNMGGPLRSAPTVRGGRVFVVTLDSRMFALAASDGRELWTHMGISETASLLGGASPAEDQGVVVVPFASGELTALRVENGQTLWSDSLASMQRIDEVSTLSHIRGNPVIDRGLVFAISHGELMVAIDLGSGRRVWEKRIGGIETPWVAGDYLFVLTTEGEVVCMGRRDGRIYWVSPLPRFEDPEDRTDPIVWTGPLLVADRLLVAGSNGYAMAVSPYSGDIIGRQKMPDAVSVAPVVAEGTVYFLSDDAELTAYR